MTKIYTFICCLYTGYSCNDGFEPIEYAGYIDLKKDEFKAFYCANSTMNKKDELNYFGGIYETCLDDANNLNESCNTVNYMTGSCSCPSGYSSIISSNGWSNQVKTSNCYQYDGDNYIIFTYLCYNKNISLTETIMGGMFANNTDNSKCDSLPNAYTKTTSCPSGFSPYPVSTYCCHQHDGDCDVPSTTYVCLNNIYPV